MIVGQVLNCCATPPWCDAAVALFQGHIATSLKPNPNPFLEDVPHLDVELEDVTKGLALICSHPPDTCIVVPVGRLANAQATVNESSPATNILELGPVRFLRHIGV